VKLVQLDAGDRVTAVARVVPEDANGAEGGEGGGEETDASEGNGSEAAAQVAPDDLGDAEE
jgi:hypothetical protein